MEDITDRMMNYLDAKIATLRKCLESCCERGVKNFNATALVAMRTVESDVIKTFALPDNRTIRNNLRSHIINVVLADE